MTATTCKSQALIDVMLSLRSWKTAVVTFQWDDAPVGADLLLEQLRRELDRGIVDPDLLILGLDYDTVSEAGEDAGGNSGCPVYFGWFSIEVPPRSAMIKEPALVVYYAIATNS